MNHNLNPVFDIHETAKVSPQIIQRLLSLHQKNGTIVKIKNEAKIADDIIFTDNLQFLFLGEHSVIGNNNVFDFKRIYLDAFSSLGDNICFYKKQHQPYISCIKKGRVNLFEELRIGFGTEIMGDNIIYAPRVIIGNFSKIGLRVNIEGYKEFIAGHNFWVGRDSTLNSTGGLEIGNNVGIGEKCSIWTHGFWSDLLEGSIIHNVEKVTIGDDCWIAVGTTINPGVNLLDKVMALPESNVTKSPNQSNIVIGKNPAIKIQFKKDGELCDMIHFEHRNKEDRFKYLHGVIKNFLNRFDQVIEIMGEDYYLFNIQQNEFKGKIILLSKTESIEKINNLFEPSNEVDNILVFSPEKIISENFTLLDYQKRTYSSLRKKDSSFNYLAMEFICDNNTRIAKFCPETETCCLDNSLDLKNEERATSKSINRSDALINQTGIIEKEEIKRIIPYGDSFLLIDSVKEINSHHLIATQKVPLNDFWTKSHFIDFPIMPGVLLVESMAQAGTILIRNNLQDTIKKDILAFNIREMKFILPVFPNDELKFDITIQAMENKKVSLECKAFVNDNLCAAGIIDLVIVDKEKFRNKYRFKNGAN